MNNVLQAGQGQGEGVDMLTRFLQVLVLCHSVVPEVDKKTGSTYSFVLLYLTLHIFFFIVRTPSDMIYRTPSPDEKALVEMAAENGFIFLERTLDRLTVFQFGRRLPKKTCVIFST